MTLREKIQAGGRITGCMLRVVRNPAVCLMAKNAGLDFVMFDCEHSNYSVETLHDNFILANAVGLGGFFRAPTVGKENISRIMDAGASGVMTPMTETAEQAWDLVRWSKYPPVGERGLGSGIAPVEYRNGVSVDGQMKYAGSRNIAIAQIESQLGVDNAEEIAGVEGVDVLLIGPKDLSISLGIPDQYDHPLEDEAIRHVIAACKKKGKAFGLSGDPGFLRPYAEDVRLMMMYGDLYALKSCFKSIVDTAATL
jgi:2-keto-3-deoxy-L-rhamnonate aldolase RhmA